MRQLILTCTALFTLSLFGQTNLDSIKVSATRLAVKKYESGKNITVLSQQEIQQLPVTTVDELLQYVGGINVNSRGGFGVQADIGMRGSTFSQVLILVDNQRINDPLTAHFNSNVPIPLSEIHHIEIVRGSAAASYGADAVGGIIHVKTKTYEGMMNTTEQTSEINGNVAFGQHNLTMTDIGVYQQRKKLGFSAAMKSSQSTGEQHVNPNYINNGIGDSLYNNFFDLKTYTGALTYRTGRLKMYGRGGVDYRDFNAKYFYTPFGSDESVERVQSYWTQAAFIFDGHDDSRTELSISYRNNSDSFTFNPAFAANVHTTQRVNATLSQQRKIGTFNLSYGFQSDWQDIVSTDRGDHKLNSNALFLVAHKNVNKLSLNGGLRLEQSEKIGVQLVPQINAAYIHRNLVFRSSLGRSIRQADFTERFSFYELPRVPAGRNIGNPDLAAESAYTFDLGVDAYITEHLQVTNTLFARTSSNLIDYTLTNATEISNRTNLADSANYFYANNISEAFTWGNELGVKYTSDLAHGQLNAALNYTFIQTTTPDSVVSKYIANHPLHNINGNLNYSIQGFGINIGGAFITRNEEAVEAINAEIKNQYAVLNAKVSYTIKDFPVSLYVDVRNILDTQYQEVLGARMPSRWILGGIRWNIKHTKVKPMVY
jgi:iron complex outermembrane receptor protein